MKRDLLNGETAFVVLSPTGDRLYWFSDLFEARAEAEELSTQPRAASAAA